MLSVDNVMDSFVLAGSTILDDYGMACSVG